MSNETIRIRTTPNGEDKYIKTFLTQDFDFLEVLSLKLTQEEVYRKFCSDYGVICGRVNTSGYGVPNCRVSVFIPIDEMDKLDPQIKGLYPYEIITDKNDEGKRYNLLSREGTSQDNCYVPVGSLPSKREFIDNDELLDIYCKYYKFTTTTNYAGDFMIFGVPLGSYTVQVDADISDIGLLSQKPYDFISQGSSEKLFDSPTKFKSSNNLDKLVQVKTFRSGVNVEPFWGDIENCEVGISRLDFDLQTDITPSAIFVGSIFGDNEKHSINKNCRPRRKIGVLSEQVVTEGTVEILRKTIDGGIEEFSVNGGRVIDEDGNWAFQVPMNLDYMVTDEFGNMVPTDNPNTGIPTRASVRFRIGMDITGGEGRLRTRAKYLVPNNPSNYSESDYTFDETTRDISFRDLYWNKIYSVKNFIPRYQANCGVKCADNRNFVGIKNVDDAVGTHNPFPYNRIDTDINPLFNIICIILTLIISVIALINGTVIYILNLVIHAINQVINILNTVIGAIARAICAIWNTINKIPGINIGDCPINEPNIPDIRYIPCITLTCDGGDGGKVYAPGCNKNNNPEGFDAASPPIDYWSSLTGKDYDGVPGHNEVGGNAGLKDCYALQIADALDVWEFDFYNDWINGSLYSYLLKYKQKKKISKGKEKFCEYDCDDFSGGVDGNNDGKADNKCHNSYLVDTCSFDDARDIQVFGLKDGLIKKVDDELYYASYTHEGDKLLYATDIINLGSVFNCDWQGLPKIQQFLIPTTYKIPSLLSEYDDDDNNKIECGMSSVGTNNGNDGLFFEINCIGVSVDYPQCYNIRKMCEMGVDTDNFDDSVDPPLPATCDVNETFIESYGRFFRDAFYGLNINGPSITSLSIPSGGFDTDFGSGSDTRPGYDSFRKYDSGGYTQPKGNSYYFYFGLKPGKTALDKMNSSFFTTCNKKIEENFIISGLTNDVTTIGGTDGSIQITILGNATAPYTYSWTGPNGFTTMIQNPSGLKAGLYKVVVVDSLGYSASATFVVNEPQALFCSVVKNSNAITTTSNEGSILIVTVGGGKPNYSYSITGPSGPINGGPSATLNNILISGLTVGNYTATITDSLGATCITTGLTITSAPLLLVTGTAANNLCYGTSTDGLLKFNIGGGVPPYTIQTTGTTYDSQYYDSMLLNQTNILAGTYTTTIIDNIGQTFITSTTITQDAKVILTPIYVPQCDPNKTILVVDINDTISPSTFEIKVDTTVTPYSGYLVSGSTYAFEVSGPEAINAYEIAVTNQHNCTTRVNISKLNVLRPITGLSATLTACTPNTGCILTPTIVKDPSRTITYKWYRDSILVGTASTQMTTLPSASYYVEITDSSGCIATSNTVTV